MKYWRFLYLNCGKSICLVQNSFFSKAQPHSASWQRYYGILGVKIRQAKGQQGSRQERIFFMLTICCCLHMNRTVKLCFYFKVCCHGQGTVITESDQTAGESTLSILHTDPLCFYIDFLTIQRINVPLLPMVGGSRPISIC